MSRCSGITPEDAMHCESVSSLKLPSLKQAMPAPCNAGSVSVLARPRGKPTQNGRARVEHAGNTSVLVEGSSS